MLKAFALMMVVAMAAYAQTAPQQTSGSKTQTSSSKTQTNSSQAQASGSQT